jgi:hypothetical protein
MIIGELGCGINALTLAVHKSARAEGLFHTVDTPNQKTSLAEELFVQSMRVQPLSQSI